MLNINKIVSGFDEYLSKRGLSFEGVALKPTLQELKDSLEWVQFQDANPTWPDHVQNIFKEVAEALGYEF